MATLMPQLERLSAPSRLLPHVHALPRVGAALSPDAMSSYAQCGESRGETNRILAFLPAPAAKKQGCDSLHHDSRHTRSEEHTSELQSQFHLVCRLLPEKKK